MRKARYDEFQLANRHGIAFQSLIIAMAVIMISGYIKYFYGIWAPPLLEMLVLVFIPGMHFMIMSIVKNAYLSRKDYPGLVIVCFLLAAVMGIFSFVPAMIDGRFVFVENGQLSDQVGSLFITAFAGGASIALLIRRMKNRKILEE